MSYQKIDIDGITIEGIDRTKDYYNTFLKDPIGKTILDIGCNVGFYCLKASKNGAKYCLGIDNHQKFLDVGEDVRKKLEFSNVKFKCFDVIENDIKDLGNFDIVLCLNLVHHFSNIDQVEKLVEDIKYVSNEKIVFEFLNTNEEFEYVKNRIGNVKIHLSEKFFRNRFPLSSIKIVDSEVTDNRKFIHIEGKIK